MEHLDFLILDLALILAVAAVATILMKKLNQPVILGYIIAGFLISPNFVWLPTVIEADNITVWADLGIVFLMFAIGLEFSIHNIAKMGGGVIVTASVNITGMISLGYFVGQMMGWSTMDSIFLGCMISMSSTMIVLKAYEELGVKRECFAKLVVGILIIEDLAGIFMMIILTTISVSNNFSGADLAKEIGILMLLLVLMLCVGIYIIPTIIKKIASYVTDEILLIFSLGFCFVMVVLSVAIGFSEALGAFLSGSILAGTKQAERIDRMIKPIKDLFGAIFFVSVGMMLVPSLLVEYWIEILIISVVVIVGQMSFSFFGSLVSGQGVHTSVRVGFSMVQVGEFSFIIATLGTSLGVISEHLYPIIVCVSVFTSFTTPMLIRSGEKAYVILEKILPVGVKTFLNKYTTEKKGSSLGSQDWKKYLIYKGSRIIVAIAGLFAVVVFMTNFVETYMYDNFGTVYWVRILLTLLGIVLMSPFIGMLRNRKSRLHMKLWYKSNFNRLPLVAIRIVGIFIALMFVMIIIKRYLLNIPTIADFIIAVTVVLLLVRSSIMHDGYMTLETRFYANFNERILEREKVERAAKGKVIWLDEKMDVISFKILDNREKPYVRDLISNKDFGCIVISIMREDGKIINLPKAWTSIYDGDVLTVVGSIEGIEAYSHMLGNDKNIKAGDTTPINLKEYLYSQLFDEEKTKEDQLMCCALKPIKKSDFLYKKAIKDSEFIPKYDGYILAIERDGLLMISPNKNLVIKENDIVWCIGTQEMVDRLEQEGVLAL